MADVRLEQVRKTFGDTVAVEALDLDVKDGEFVVLLGPTGAGKTTTLRLIAGLEQPDSGRFAIAGADVTASPPAAHDVAMVFQQFSLYPHHSVFDNLAFPLRSPLPRERGSDPGSGVGDRVPPARREQARQPRHLAFGRRDAAGRHWPRAGPPPTRVPYGRAALLARRQAAQGFQDRDQAHPARARRHHPLRDTRPDRGHDDGRPHRRDRGGPPAAVRIAVRDL
jgi:ABC-type dipeptide/oligopeptide/nickel transport system ATPase subunit